MRGGSGVCWLRSLAVGAIPQCELPGTGLPQGDRIDSLQVGGVGEHAHIDAGTITQFNINRRNYEMQYNRSTTV